MKDEGMELKDSSAIYYRETKGKLEVSWEERQLCSLSGKGGAGAG